MVQRIHLKVCCAVVVCVAIAVIVAGLHYGWHCNDFCDYPATILGVSDDGEFSLQTYEGIAKGQLGDVKWLAHPEFLREARAVVGRAQTGEIDWGFDRKGRMHIRYRGKNNSGISLNDEIEKISRKYRGRLATSPDAQ